jgi:IclR family transcriptional regulator, acetate operon repressor
VTSPNGTQAVDRAAQLLTQVVHGAEPVTFTELAAASGLAKSTTSRLLMALERHQLVRRDSGGRFWPGELFIRYASRGTAGTDLVAVSRPYLDRLGRQTGETVNLGIASGGGGGAGGGVPGGGSRGGDGGGTVVEQIAQVDSRYMIGGTNWVGLSVPLHCSALGKVLVAFGAAELAPGRLPRRTARTITTRTALQAELAVVRKRGYAVTVGELEPGLVAVAAPVFAAGPPVGSPAVGSPAVRRPVAIAAISVSGPASRLTADQIPAVAAQCATAARDLSAILGYSQTAGCSQTEGAA